MHAVIRRSFFLSLCLLTSGVTLADGLVRAPREYKGSLEETSQEAILIFDAGDEKRSATQDMILKIGVEGKTSEFAWVVPMPNAPKTKKADQKLFEELFNYVEARRERASDKKQKGDGEANAKAAESLAVKVISREIVGNFEVSVVKEQEAGALNQWLKKEGYKTLDGVAGADDVLGYYRKKGFVFTCIKVSDAALGAKVTDADLHPLHFRFETGGRDGVFFPMRLTGLQSKAFAVNLYVFHRYWINDKLNEHGYTNRDFFLKYRDWDTRQCVANGGKAWDNPKSDPLLKGLAHKLPKVSAFFAKEHPGKRFYLTNIEAFLAPKKVRNWPNDLWLFPHYTNRKFTPYDAREGGPAAWAAKAR